MPHIPRCVPPCFRLWFRVGCVHAGGQLLRGWLGGTGGNTPVRFPAHEFTFNRRRNRESTAGNGGPPLQTLASPYCCILLLFAFFMPAFSVKILKKTLAPRKE